MDPVDDGDGFLVGLDGDVDVAAAGELIGGGGAEAAHHLVVARLVGAVRRDRHGEGGQRERDDTCPVRRERGLAPPGQYLPLDVVEVDTGIRTRLELLGLQLARQVALQVLACAQHGRRYGAGQARSAIDEQEFFFDTH